MCPGNVVRAPRVMSRPALLTKQVNGSATYQDKSISRATGAAAASAARRTRRLQLIARRALTGAVNVNATPQASLAPPHARQDSLGWDHTGDGVPVVAATTPGTAVGLMQN